MDQIRKNLLINLSNYIDSRIAYNNSHSFHVAHLGYAVARKMNISQEQIHSFYWASLLHDVGKISIPEEILVKNGPLSKNEWLIMKLHPIVSANLVNSDKSLINTIPLIIAHQEKYDGSGYPEGLKGESIPLCARILTVVDAFDSMINDRVYRPACSQKDALFELQDMKGKHFDPHIVDIFIELITNSDLEKKTKVNKKNYPSSDQERRISPWYHPGCSTKEKILWCYSHLIIQKLIITPKGLIEPLLSR
jgi:HD-GYP domain-containing protein (c-di-GMP phosphodiesterase class II)